MLGSRWNCTWRAVCVAWSLLALLSLLSGLPSVAEVFALALLLTVAEEVLRVAKAAVHARRDRGIRR